MFKKNKRVIQNQMVLEDAVIDALCSLRYGKK